MTVTAAPQATPASMVASPAPVTSRLTSLDVFRGITMLFMASEILHIPSVARQFPDSSLARFLADMLDHRAWVGCAPWDLIQPAFMFMVGVSLPYSLASRRAKGQSFSRMLAHSAVRAFVLIALGIFLRSQARPQTYFTFEDVLTQIGLGYVFLFLLAWTRASHAVRGRRPHPRRLLGCVRPLPASRPGLRHDDRWCPRRLAAPRHRLRGALGQEHQPGRQRSTSGSSTSFLVSGPSSTTAAVT